MQPYFFGHKKICHRHNIHGRLLNFYKFFNFFNFRIMTTLLFRHSRYQYAEPVVP